ncbi:hypothetical protein ACSX1A_03280 [Pontibacter sp. MBLB2868]|uniref:hypothetical protein n=1 Tax=Pontibacter sp. MBLB2868 TaxID=3451555 RepID=UPI003F752C41
MGRLVLVIVMLLISGIIYLVKAGASKVTGREVDFQDESRKVMEKTAKGIGWMNDQWEKAKSNANGGTMQTIGSGEFGSMSATEIIVRIKSNPSKYDLATAEATYIDQAVKKMNSNQLDQAEKLIMQLQPGEARDFMLSEIREKQYA